ncbi:MAG: amidase [Acidobacteriota bacterium]|nr:amidase [Acidobacteriota bacterium]
MVLPFLLADCRRPGPVGIDVTELTIAKIHLAYQEGRYSCAQLVQAYIERIKRYDHAINAITMINPGAIEIARALDREFKKTGQLRPLHGIPMIVKDNFATKGLPTTGGSLALKDFIPAEDACMVARLKAAGAVIIAKSNMAEWAFSPMHTESSTGGTTRNPYNPEYVPAGSSGGTAAAIAANFGVIGLGTDTGNSIRGPSSHTALVGFRPTLGLVSRHGIIPLYLRNDVGGPMCRTTEDAARVLEVIAGNDPNDPITRHSKDRIPRNYTQFLDRNGLTGARIGVLRELSDDNPDAEVKALFEKAVADLISLGAEVVDPFDVPGFKRLSENQWCDDFRKDIEMFLAEFVKSDRLRTLEDIIRAGSESQYARESLDYFAAHSGRPEHPEIECGNAYTDPRRIAFRQAIEQRMDELQVDAVIYPTWNNRPARIEAFEEAYRGDNNQVIAPHTGQPAFTVPMGVTQGNLPAGLQFLGRMFAEPTLIKLAYAYEQATAHRTVPAGLP